MERDRCSTSRRPSGRGSTDSQLKIGGMMNTAHISVLLWKDNYLRSQVPTCASTFVCTSDELHSSWRPSSSHTPRMWTGSSLQRKGPGRGTSPLKVPNRRPSLWSKFILASAIYSYLTTAFFTTSMSERRDTKTVISSANAEIFAK